MDWFKHYNTASDGATLRTLWDNKDYEAYGLWWRLLELISRWESPDNRGSITISWSVLSRETNWKPSRCRRVLARICSVSKVEMNEKQDGNVTFLVPNWLELQEHRGGKRIPKIAQKPGRSKSIEVRNKKEEIREPALPRLASLWNSKTSKFSKVIACSQTRKRHADARFAEHPDESFWLEVFLAMEQSDFLTGKNDRGWKADFDWLVKPDSVSRILEGKYANKSPAATTNWEFIFGKDYSHAAS